MNAATPVDEKWIVLEISLRLAEILQQAGFDTVLTRDRDVYVSLADRARIANEAGADLFLSVHANASPSASASGMEVLYNPAHVLGELNLKLAAAVRSTLSITMNRFGVRDRGLVERSDLYVLNNTNMPGCMVETAFMTNPADLAVLLEPEHQRQIAGAIAEGARLFAGKVTVAEKASPLLAASAGIILAGWWFAANRPRVTPRVTIPRPAETDAI